MQGPLRKRRKLRWRQGTEGTLWGRFSFCRVKTIHDDGAPIDEREEQWLIIEWPLDDEQATKFHLTSLPRRTSYKQIIRIIKKRWRTERMYEDLKGELGLDHFEGRSFQGWHHHVSVVICCFAFIVAEKSRVFPPLPNAKMVTARSVSRPERHFADAFITFRIEIARALVTWLPRCPLCHQSQ